jgi:hypothetical protein
MINTKYVKHKVPNLGFTKEAKTWSKYFLLCSYKLFKNITINKCNSQYMMD